MCVCVCVCVCAHFFQIQKLDSKFESSSIYTLLDYKDFMVQSLTTNLYIYIYIYELQQLIKIIS
jgi:hypothetical protein